MRHGSGDHASEDVLEEYSLGTLSGEELDEFEEHLLVCPVCQDRLEETDRFIRAFRIAAARMDASPPRLRADPAWAMIRALLLRPAPALILAGALLAITVGWRLFSPEAHLAAVPVVLEAHRGAGAGTAPSGTPLALRLDAFGLPDTRTYAVEIVDASGNSVLSTFARRSRDQIEVTAARGFETGSYWVRVLGASRELLREYGLRVSEDPSR